MALFVLSLCPFDISVGVGAFVIGLSQISSFFSQNNRNVLAVIVFSRVVKLHPLLTMRIFHNEISNEYQQVTGASLTVDVPCENLLPAEDLSCYITDTTPVITVFVSVAIDCFQIRADSSNYNVRHSYS